MKMKYLALILMIPLLFSLASATTLNVKDNYNAGDLVFIQGSCASDGKNVGVQITTPAETVYVDQTISSSESLFNSSYRLPSTASGVYTVYVACSGEIAKFKSFTIGDAPQPPDSDDEQNDSGRGFREEGPECSNGIDDDNDAFIDYPADDGCIDAEDDSEYTAPIQSQSPPPAKKPIILPKIPPIVSKCGDGECGLMENDNNCPEDCSEEETTENYFFLIWVIVILFMIVACVWEYHKGFFDRFKVIFNNPFSKFDKDDVEYQFDGNKSSKTLLNYVKKEREKGFSDSKIKEELVQSGWEKHQIEGAFRN